MSRAVPSRRKQKESGPAKKGASAALDEKVAGLTPSSNELLDYADSHPVPETFWHGADDPSQSVKAPAKR